MGYNKATSDSLIERMQHLANMAMKTEDGLRIETGSRSESLRLRQQIYAARRETRKRKPEDTSPISVVELRVEEDHLLILKPGALTSQFKITDIKTGQPVSAVPTAEDTKEILSNVRKITDADILEMMLKIAEKKGPGNHEQEALDWLHSGKTPNQYKG